jgi:hypothetical protein
MTDLSMEAQLAVMSNSLNNMVSLFDAHTQQDMVQLKNLDTKLDDMMERVMHIQIQLAEEAGERKGSDQTLKRTAGLISFIVSLAVAIGAMLISRAS